MRTMAFPDSQDVEFLIKLDKYDQVDQISSDLSQETLESLSKDIRDRLLSDSGTYIAERVIFANRPVIGAWEHAGLSMKQVPDEAPRPHQLAAPHPFVLQVQYQGVPDSLTRTLRFSQAIFHTHALLSVLLTGLRPLPGSGFSASWGLPAVGPDDPPAEEIQNRVSQLYQPGYFCSNLSGSYGEKIPILSDEAYYGRPGVYIGEKFDLPSSLPTRLSQYSRLNSSDLRQFQRAIHWYTHSLNVAATSRSAALVAAIQAIESLMPKQLGIRDECPECNRDRGPGPTKKFKEFIEHYYPFSASEKNRKTMYSERSNLTHGWDLLYADRGTPFGWNHPAMAFEHGLVEHAQQTARGALINWLSARGQSGENPGISSFLEIKHT